MNETPSTIKATGGFAKSEVWRQMMVDIFDTDLIVPESYEFLFRRLCGFESIREIDDFSIIEEWSGQQCANNRSSVFSVSIFIQ